MKKKKTLLDFIRMGRYDDVVTALETASQDDINEFGQTPLMIAIHATPQKDSDKIFKAILDWTRDVNKKDVDGYSAFSHAVSLRRVNYIDKLLQRDVDVNVPCFITVAPHHRAYEAYERDMSTKKRAVYPRCSSQKISPLCAVIYKSYDYFVPSLVEKGANLDAIGGLDITALSMAIRSDKLDIVQYLLDRGANPNVVPKNWKTYAKSEDEVCPVALKKALKYGCGASISLLLKAGSRLPKRFLRRDDFYSTPLTYLFSQPKEQLSEPYYCLRKLQKRIDVASCDSDNRSALSYAIENNFDDYLIASLMHEKINNLADRFFCTPMIYAWINRDTKVMKLLYDAGVPMASNAYEPTGQTLLMMSLEKKDYQMVSFLMQHSPMLLNKDKEGRSVLSYIDETVPFYKEISEGYALQQKKMQQYLQRNK